MVAAFVWFKFRAHAELEGTPSVFGSMETMLVYHRSHWGLIPFTGSRPDQEHLGGSFGALIDPCTDLIPEGTASMFIPSPYGRHINHQELVPSGLHSGQTSGAIASCDTPRSETGNIDSEFTESQLCSWPIRNNDSAAKCCTWHWWDRLQGGFVHSRGRSSPLLWRNLKRGGRTLAGCVGAPRTAALVVQR